MTKKEQIVHAAIQVFREQGIDKTKISDIVKVAGIAQGTFYLYFPSKLALMPAIAEVMVEKTMTMVKEKVGDDDVFPKQLEHFVDAIFLVNEEYREIQALIYSGLAASEHIKEWEAVYEPFYKWLSEKLASAREEGWIRQTVQPKQTAKLIIGLVESAAEQIYLYDTNTEEEARIQKAQVNEFLAYALSMR
ncbi:TetR/AcrR family transcriptional regulator [Bacillaceae bacterium SIJ1]|uniref:TetR family transcriptional regulator n=1 Tax=Litoribacterium kuwaitense TaxID=1398745 RepID=UPI0013ECE055|nr:TetR family transcriptional regulator [Litoribacterium kuwaitense]NGP45562.1 TetR/AcrR family transcriptional regulator [Litoribacterium kuwaitense]